MTGLAGHIQLVEEQFEDFSQSDLITASNMALEFVSNFFDPNQYLSSKPHPSVEAFSDFDALGRSNESANIGLVKENQKIAVIEAEKQEKKKDQQQDTIIDFIAVLKEQQLERLKIEPWRVGDKDWDVSDAGIDATIERIHNDLDGMAEEYGLSDEQKQVLETLGEELEGKSKSEQEAILNRYDTEHPDVVDVFMDNTEKQSRSLAPKAEHTQKAEVQTEEKTVQNTNVEASSFDDLFDDSFSAPSEISASFNSPAQGETPSQVAHVGEPTTKIEFGLS